MITAKRAIIGYGKPFYSTFFQGFYCMNSISLFRISSLISPSKRHNNYTGLDLSYTPSCVYDTNIALACSIFQTGVDSNFLKVDIVIMLPILIAGSDYIQWVDLVALFMSETYSEGTDYWTMYETQSPFF